jgi:hypothetical protein
LHIAAASNALSTQPGIPADVPVYFILLKLVVSPLQTRHARTYLRMGERSLYERNNIPGHAAVGRFIVRRRHLALDDRHLAFLSDTMLVLGAVYLLFFACAFGSIFFGVSF